MTTEATLPVYGHRTQTNMQAHAALARAGASREKDVRAVSEQFVGFFLGEIVKAMRKTVQQGEIGHGGPGERVFQELMDEEVGKEMARSDAGGLTDLVYKSMLRRESLSRR